ncbi:MULTISPECIES: hypothetical protein [unclassified Microcoleus]|uniref:hypothetical protein n=1 Tax=unclassified Microcoleus TaxID=2642155 RepID=UPI0025FD91A0|nr:MULTISPECIES: hypothetical protein [unclassified Microcoleus]
MPLIIPDFLLTFAFYWLATIALLLPNCLCISNTPTPPLWQVEVRILNAGRRYILVVAQVWDNKSILGWEKMRLCDRQQRSIAIGITINRELVIGYWLLVIGCWLLVVGYWLLVIGYWLLVVGYWLLVVGYWLLVIGCWLLVVGYWLLVMANYCIFYPSVKSVKSPSHGEHLSFARNIFYLSCCPRTAKLIHARERGRSHYK